MGTIARSGGPDPSDAALRATRPYSSSKMRPSAS